MAELNREKRVRTVERRSEPIQDADPRVVVPAGDGQVSVGGQRQCVAEIHPEGAVVDVDGGVEQVVRRLSKNAGEQTGACYGALNGEGAHLTVEGKVDVCQIDSGPDDQHVVQVAERCCRRGLSGDAVSAGQGGRSIERRVSGDIIRGDEPEGLDVDERVTDRHCPGLASGALILVERDGARENVVIIVTTPSAQGGTGSAGGNTSSSHTSNAASSPLSVRRSRSR